MQLHKLSAIVVLAALLAASCIVAGPSASAATPVTNDRIGDRVVFYQDYSRMYQVPDNMFLYSTAAPHALKNSTLSYDYVNPSIRYDRAKESSGNLYIGGLTAALQTNTTLDIMLSRESTAYKATYIINVGNAASIYLTYSDIGDHDQLRLQSFYYLSSGGESVYDVANISLPSNGATSFHCNITVSSNGLNGTNTIMYNGAKVLHTPFLWRDHYLRVATPYSTFVNPWIGLNVIMSSTPNGSAARASIFSITQTVPEYRYVTPIGNPDIAPIGFDGPMPWGTIDDGVALLQSYGGKGTIWVDVPYLASYSAEELMALKALLADRWELGIHFTYSLGTMSMSNAINSMKSQHAAISAVFGQSPTSWVSLGNNENSSHAAYAYEVLGMVWRNGNNGPGQIVSSDGWFDSKMVFLENSSKAGLVMPAYAHRTDDEPAVNYSIGPDNYSKILANFADAGIKFVPWLDYWQMAQNTNVEYISSVSAGSEWMDFTVDNIGGKSRYFVAAPYTEIFNDAVGNGMNYLAVEGGVVVDLASGSYRLSSEAGQSQREMSAMTAMMLSMMVVVMVLGLVGTMFSGGRRR